jgi:6-phosphogluconolactonase
MRAVKELLLLALVPILLAALADAQADEPAKPEKAVPNAASGAIRIYVGTYTEGESKGIYRLLLDPATGRLTPQGSPAEAVSPSFLAMSEDGTRLFAVNETGSSAADPPGSVTSFSVDPATGALALLGRASSSGPGPCHLSLDKGGKHVLVANYWGGSVAVLPVRRDGRLGGATAFVRHAGENPTPRGPGPHAHAIRVDPSDRWALVTDLGLDTVFVYPYDAERGALGPVPRPVEMEKGAGPRHLAFDPDGRGVFVLNELNGTVVSFAFDPTDGSMVRVDSMSTLAAGYQGKNKSAEVAVSPDGRFLYASNRGPDDIAVFEILRPSRRLRLVGRQATGGRYPRHFAIDPSGRFLVVAHRDSDSVRAYRIDPATGLLSYASGPVTVPRAVCVLMGKTAPDK